MVRQDGIKKGRREQMWLRFSFSTRLEISLSVIVIYNCPYGQKVAAQTRQGLCCLATMTKRMFTAKQGSGSIVWRCFAARSTGTNEK